MNAVLRWLAQHPRALNVVGARLAVGDQLEGRIKEHWFVRALVAIPLCSADDTDIQIVELHDGIIGRADPRLGHHGVEWNDSRSNARRSGDVRAAGPGYARPLTHKTLGVRVLPAGRDWVIVDR